MQEPSGLVRRSVVHPTPLWTWSLVWRRDDHHPRLPALLDAFGAAGRESRWLEFHPAADWLPGPDLAAVTRTD